MRLHPSLLGPSFLLILATTSLSQATAPSSATTAPAAVPAPLDAKWTDLLARLASDDFKTRSAAQKELAKLPYSDRPLLERLAVQSGDPEVKSRLATRAQEMEVEQAIDPPPISIDLKNARLKEVAAALSKATGARVDAAYGSFDSDATDPTRCTLNLVNAPFWDVFSEINKLTKLTINTTGTTFTLIYGAPSTNFTRARGFAVFPQSLERTANIDLQAPTGEREEAPRLQFSYMVVADPRMNIFSATEHAVLTEVTDDLGNSLLFEKPAPQSLSLGYRWCWNESAYLKVPEKPGKKIASAEGNIHCVVALATVTREIADFDKNTAQSIDVGGKTFKFSTFNLTKHNFNYDVSMSDNNDHHEKLPGQEPPAITVTLTDADGKEVITRTFRDQAGGSMGSSAQIAKLPLKLRLSYPTRTKDVTIPFEFKDLPLPAK